MVLSRGSTGTLTQVVNGSTTYLLSFLEFVQPSRKTCHVCQQKWYVARQSSARRRLLCPLCSIYSLFLRVDTAVVLFIFLLISIRYTHMYVLRDSHKHPLTLLNDGPFRILRRFDKHFTLGINGKSKEITVDRLKPAERIGNPHILRHSQLFERTLAFQMFFPFIRPSLPGQAAQVAGQHTSPIISDW